MRAWLVFKPFLFYSTLLGSQESLLVGQDVKNFALIDGEIIQQLEVAVIFPRKKAPFKRFALVNCGRKLPIAELSGLEAKLLLTLVFGANTFTLKDLAEIVGTPTSCAARSLRRLVDLTLVEKLGRGNYRASRFLVHYGKWKAENESQEN